MSRYPLVTVVVLSLVGLSIGIVGWFVSSPQPVETLAAVIVLAAAVHWLVYETRRTH